MCEGLIVNFHQNIVHIIQIKPNSVPRFGQNSVSGSRYSNRRTQEEEEEVQVEEQPTEDEDGQEVETEEPVEPRKR